MKYELRDVVSEWIAAGFECVIDVGSAEGYYAVGFALAIQHAVVHAFDTDLSARERCTAMAELNRVAARVRVEGACDPVSLNAFPKHGVALLSDCEGAERTLLNPELAPRLRDWPILVELRDFIDPSITQTICSRFANSHEIEIIEGAPRGREAPTELSLSTARQRAALLSEHRPEQMRWAYMRPRKQPS
jgi:hypothetical protein